MNKRNVETYQEAEKQLAELLGWTKLESVKYFQGEHHYYVGVKNEVVGIVPEWCLDDAAAFQLMVEHNCYPDCNCDDIMASHSIPMNTSLNTPAYTLVSDHPDKPTAIRYAICMAVIAKLKGEVK